MKVIVRSNVREKLIAVRLNATLIEDTTGPTYNRKEWALHLICHTETRIRIRIKSHSEKPPIEMPQQNQYLTFRPIKYDSKPTRAFYGLKICLSRPSSPLTGVSYGGACKAVNEGGKEEEGNRAKGGWAGCVYTSLCIRCVTERRNLVLPLIKQWAFRWPTSLFEPRLARTVQRISALEVHVASLCQCIGGRHIL